MISATVANAFGIISRIIAGLAGGLILMNAAVAALSNAPMTAITAYYVSGILSVAIWTVAFLWAFSSKSALRSVLSIAVVFAGLALLTLVTASS